jgi:hypothetical protein
LEVHGQGRDSVMAPYACVTGNWPLPSGMSGGPMLLVHQEEVDLLVCGISTAGMEPAVEHTTWSSLGAIMPPTLALEVPLEIDGKRRNWPLLELAERDLIAVDDTWKDNVMIERGDDGHFVVHWRDQRSDAEAARPRTT